jgi:hypothetical protein
MSPQDLARFRDLILIGPGCWEWTGKRFNSGYGCFRMRGEARLAHRVMMALVQAGIPEGACVLHHCDNPPCVRPSHLFFGGHRDNALDAISKGRMRGPAVSSVAVRHQLAAGVSQSRIAREAGVSRQRVWQIAHPLD